VRRGAARAKFAMSWMLSVLVPYTLLSSKLDVYMITMLPAVALLVARYAETNEKRGRIANVVMLVLFAIIGVAGLVVQPSQIKGEDGSLVVRMEVRALFVVLLLAAIVAVVVTLRGSLTASTLATGFVAVAALTWVSLGLMPLANEAASTRPLLRALERQEVSPKDTALFVVPHLWTRGMNPAFAQAEHRDAEELLANAPAMLVVRRKDAEALAPLLPQYRKVDELRMVGKWFDVYRR
jgi:4-amino-4-deoxy-L-arabinose transferase-like glycosyltransferase